MAEQQNEGTELMSAVPRGKEINNDVHIGGFPQVVAQGSYVPIEQRIKTTAGWSSMEQLVEHLAAVGEEPLKRNAQGDYVRVVTETTPRTDGDETVYEVRKVERYVALTREGARSVTQQGLPCDAYMMGVGWIRNGIKPERDHATLAALQQKATAEVEVLTREELMEQRAKRTEKTVQALSPRRAARRAERSDEGESPTPARATGTTPDRASAARAAQQAAREEKKD